MIQCGSSCVTVTFSDGTKIEGYLTNTTLTRVAGQRDTRTEMTIVSFSESSKEPSMVNVTLKADLPEIDGFEYTGEYRKVKCGEWYFGEANRGPVECRNPHGTTYHHAILRKKFRCEEGKWYVTRDGKQIVKYKTTAWHPCGTNIYGYKYKDLVREATADDLK